MYNINRRKFLGYFGCSCCSLMLPSCATVPITERKQLSIISESRINKQAAAAYENFRNKSKLITSGSQLKEIRNIDVIKGGSNEENVKVDNSSFLKAIWTVLLADFTMSLDNVLGVAGAAGHHYHLLIFGLNSTPNLFKLAPLKSMLLNL